MVFFFSPGLSLSVLVIADWKDVVGSVAISQLDKELKEMENDSSKKWYF